MLEDPQELGWRHYRNGSSFSDPKREEVLLIQRYKKSLPDHPCPFSVFLRNVRIHFPDRSAP